jgi:hypothetical protein
MTPLENSDNSPTLLPGSARLENDFRKMRARQHESDG